MDPVVKFGADIAYKMLNSDPDTREALLNQFAEKIRRIEDTAFYGIQAYRRDETFARLRIVADGAPHLEEEDDIILDHLSLGCIVQQGGIFVFVANPSAARVLSRLEKESLTS